MDYKCEQILLGSLLGDGGLDMGSRNARFTVKHCSRDRNYLFWKFSILRATGWFVGLPKFRPNRNSGSWRIQSMQVPTFTDYYHLFYHDGRKGVLLEVLNKLEPLGLAVWYMDDGHLGYSYGIYPSVWLYTQSFSREENLMIQLWLRQKYGVRLNLTKVKTGSGFLLKSSAQCEARKFLKIVTPYILPCMARKLERGVLSGQAKAILA